MEFWRRSVFYEIYMKSFQDSNGDGLGDFKGLTSRLDYLVDLGIDGIWLTPFYPSPQVDNGYDVSDYCDINPDYGDMTDFRAFMKAADARGIKVIIDLVLNHSSTEHAWFKESRSSKTNPKRDYYIWRENQIIGNRFLVVLLGKWMNLLASITIIVLQKNRLT